MDATLRENNDSCVTGTCPYCGTKCNQCLLYSKRFSRLSSKNNYILNKAHVRVCQESRDHYDSEPFNIEEGDDSQHSESAPYHDDGFSHNNESSGDVQSDIAESNITKETFDIFSNSK